MPYEFKLPDLGEGIHEGELRSWLVKEGDQVKEDQTICEVETDKAVVEIPSPKTGKILRINGKAGDKIKTGEILVVIGSGEEAEEEKVEEPIEKEELVIQPNEEDLISEISQKEDKKPPKRVQATPYVRKIARELGVSIEEIDGTGSHGRITEDDIRKFTSGEKPSPKQEIKTKGKTQTVQNEERIPLRGLRKTISEHMVKSFHTSVHVTHVEEVNVDKLVELREQHKEKAKEKGVHLTYIPFIIRAVEIGLKKYPYINSSLDESTGEIVLKKCYNISFAVDTSEGLITPNVKRVDDKSIMQIAKEVQELAQKAKERKLTMNELKEGTFSITNIGSLGGLFATPIINYPESAILGLSTIRERPIVKNDQIKIAKMMYVSLTFDHRIIDGAVAARFVNEVKAHLEDPSLLLLDID